MDDSYELHEVQWFTTGTVGPKGQRTFYLQARTDDGVVSLQLEKQQVDALGQHLAQMLADLPEVTAQEWTSAPDLIEPIEPLWIVGAMGAAYDTRTDSVVLMAEQMELDDEVDSDVMTFRLGRGQTLAFVERANEVVGAGRPPCPWCNRPLNHGEDGFCPCWN